MNMRNALILDADTNEEIVYDAQLGYKKKLCSFFMEINFSSELPSEKGSRTVIRHTWGKNFPFLSNGDHLSMYNR
jgi:hypothetical protein